MPLYQIQENIKKQVNLIGKREYIELKHSSIYKTTITEIQVSEIAKDLNISEELVHAVLLSTPNIRVE